jgi:hypothetical protein
VVPTTRLLAVSPTGDELGFSRNGMVYVLSGVVAQRQARVHRIFVTDVPGGAINDSTVQPLNDLYIRGVPSFFVELGSYHNFIATDGAVLFNTIPGNQISGPALAVLSVFKTGDRYNAKNSNQFVANSAGNNLVPVSPASSIRQLIRSSASGAWLLSGGAGLILNE